MFNLARSTEDFVSYSALESLKDGLIFSGKYESKLKCFSQPHVLVFANFGPNDCEDEKGKIKISPDRIFLIDLDEEGLE